MGLMLLNDTKLRELFTKKGRTYAPNSIIFLENDTGGEMYIVVSGEVEISKTYQEQELFGGSRLTLGSISETIAILKAGDFFGEMALVNQEPRMASARARTQVEVIVLKGEDLETLMMRSPVIAVQMLKSVCNRLREVCEAPRLQTVLPELQKLILSIQDRRTPRKAAGRPFGAPEEATLEAAPAARTASGAPIAGEKVQAVRKCKACGYSARPDDKFCGRCGKSLG